MASHKFIISKENISIPVPPHHYLFRKSIFSDLDLSQPLHLGIDCMLAIVYQQFPIFETNKVRIEWLIHHLNEIAMFSYGKHERNCYLIIFKIFKRQVDLKVEYIDSIDKLQMNNCMNLHDLHIIPEIFVKPFLVNHLTWMTVKEYEKYTQYTDISDSDSEFKYMRSYIPLPLRKHPCNPDDSYCTEVYRSMFTEFYVHHNADVCKFISQKDPKMLSFIADRFIFADKPKDILQLVIFNKDQEATIKRINLFLSNQNNFQAIQDIDFGDKPFLSPFSLIFSIECRCSYPYLRVYPSPCWCVHFDLKMMKFFKPLFIPMRDPLEIPDTLENNAYYLSDSENDDDARYDSVVGIKKDHNGVKTTRRKFLPDHKRIFIPEIKEFYRTTFNTNYTRVSVEW